MAGGPLAPWSIDLSQGSGNLSSQLYVPATNTNGAGSIEGIGVVASLATDSPAILKFLMPAGSIPSGTLKLCLDGCANATTGTAKVTVKDINVAAGNSLGTASLTSETQLSQTWATADIIVRNKIVLTSTPNPLDWLIVVLDFNATGWTLAQNSVWVPSAIWEP
jgi:hypothetical protein